jgi:hypothetical protein
VRNKARVEGCIAHAFACKEIMNFSSMYFSRANNINAHTPRYHIEEVVLLSELKIFNGMVKVLGLLVHILLWTKSGTIPCFTCIQIWKKSYHILRSLTRYIGNKVNNLH